MTLKGYEIWQEAWGRWKVYCKDSPYSRESDYMLRRTKKDAIEAARVHKEERKKQKEAKNET